MRLLLIRHGQTPSNVVGALDTVVPGPGLTELGLAQAAAIPDALDGEGIGALYASVQTRAQLTIAPLAARLGLPVEVREGAREIGAGDLEMRRDRASIELYHHVSFGWAFGDRDRRMPGAENGHEVFARFSTVVAEIVDSGHDTVAMVAHGQIIRAWVAAHAANLDAAFASRHILHNTGIIALDGEPDAGWAAISWTGVAIGGAQVDDDGATGPGGQIDRESAP